MINVDRISTLPDPLIHLIFSFLDMKEVLLTSLLSKRWRDLWISLPYINFDYLLWADSDRSDIKYKRFGDRALLLRDGSDILKFSLNGNGGNDPYMIELWVTSVVRRHVQEICLKNTDLIATTLNFIGRNVKSLQLVSVTLPEVSETGELQLSFTILEDLIMKNCDGYDENYESLTLYAPQLKHLILDDRGTIFSEIRIITPKLKLLKCKVDTHKEYSLDNMSSLVTVHIETNITRRGDKAEDSEAFGRCLNKIFRGVANAKFLKLSAHGFQVFPEIPNLLKSVTISLHNLRYLKLTHWCSDDYMHAIAELLESFPYIETLVLKRTKVVLDSSIEGRDWESRLPKFTMCHLKSIEIQSPEGCENEVKFLEFLLRNATELQNITMTTTQIQLEKEKLVDFCKKLELVPKASSSVTILLKERSLIAYKI